MMVHGKGSPVVVSIEFYALHVPYNIAVPNLT